MSALAGCLVPTAPPDGDETGSTTSTSSTSTSTSATAATTEPENPSGPEMTQPNPSSPDSDSDTTMSADESTGASEDTTGASGQPNGYFPCVSDDECTSGNCFDMGVLQGICSECDADEDCPEFGCNPPDIANPVLPAVCGDGELGAGCEDASACVDGLTCEFVLAIPLVHEFPHCSGCATHDDCSGDELCSVTIDVTTISGFWSCLGPGSVDNGGTCDHDGDGDEVCASGNCAEADIDNLVFIGLCSECDADGDCLEGWHCQPADVDTFNVVAVPAVCVQD